MGCCGVRTWPDPNSSEGCGGGRDRELAPESSWHDEVVLGGDWRQGVPCPQTLGTVRGQHGVGKMAVMSPREEDLAEKWCFLGRKAINYFTNGNSQEVLVSNLYQG